MSGYPKLFGMYRPSFVTHKVFNNYSLLIKLEGSDKTLKPYMLCGHVDVVDVEKQGWNMDPFGGTMDDTYVYGRGALDDKNNVMVSWEWKLEKGLGVK